jgi:hypothetical protein
MFTTSSDVHAMAAVENKRIGGGARGLCDWFSPGKCSIAPHWGRLAPPSSDQRDGSTHLVKRQKRTSFSTGRSTSQFPSSCSARSPLLSPAIRRAHKMNREACCRTNGEKHCLGSDVCSLLIFASLHKSLLADPRPEINQRAKTQKCPVREASAFWSARQKKV